MKGKIENSRKYAIFSSLHMKRNPLVSKNEKCFNFLKMDKKNVQIWKVKILLTGEKFCLDKKTYRLSLNEKYKFL
jgi:hypothetical protein